MSVARVDLLLIAQMVERGARVLDVGCGDGELLRLLSETRDVDARGIELSQRGVNDCVAKGLFVIQGDADTDLADYPDDAFDYVIRPCRPPASQGACWSRCCASVGAPSCPSPISAIGAFAGNSPRRAACP